MRKGDPEVGHDIKPKYLVGGTYKRHVLEKEGKGRSSASQMARVYIAIPPPEGWPGGMPEKNGYRGGRK